MNNVSGSMTVTAPIEIKNEDLSDIICSAFEGGSNYWLGGTKKIFAEGKTAEDYEYPLYEIPFDGGTVMVKDGHGDFDPKPLNAETIQKALKIIAEKWRWHFDNIINDNADVGGW
jgi:hypothetical protein